MYPFTTPTTILCCANWNAIQVQRTYITGKENSVKLVSTRKSGEQMGEIRLATFISPDTDFAWLLCCSFVLLLTFWSKVIYRGTMNLFYLTDNIVVRYVHFHYAFKICPYQRDMCRMLNYFVACGLHIDLKKSILGKMDIKLLYILLYIMPIWYYMLLHNIWSYNLSLVFILEALAIHPS